MLERSRFKVVLLDEYQDTSVAQAVMLSRLFGGGHAVTAVGDPNQAIYGWRGASVSNILNFAETFPAAARRGAGPPADRQPALGRRILEVANRLAAPLYEKYRQVEPLEPKPEARAGDGHDARSSRPTPRSSRGSSTRSGTPMTEAWSKIGVLTRDNAHAEEVFDALTGAGIPVEIVGLSGLLRLPEVAEIVAILHLLHDVTANAALLTLLTGPRWAIGPRDLRLLSRRAHELAGRHGRGGRARDHHRPPPRDRRRHRPGRDPVARRRAGRPR